VLDRDGSLAILNSFGEESLQDSKVRVLYTEGYGVSTGTWTMADGNLSVRFKMIFSYAQPYPAERSEVWKYTRTESGFPLAIDTGQIRLVRTQSIEDVDKLLRIIDWRKSQAGEP